MTTQNALNTQLVLPAGSTAINSLLYTSAANMVAGLATVNSAALVTSSTGVPTWLGSLTNGQIIIGSTGAIPVASTLTAGTNVTITNAAGSITINATAAGTVNSGLINQLAYYAAAGTAVSGLTTANNGILVTSGTGVPSIATTFGQGLAVASSQLSVGAANNIPFNTGKGFQDNNGNSLLLFTVTASAVNYINITNNSTGNSPIVAATGTDSNVLLTLNGKGTSGVGTQGTTAGGNAVAGYVGELISSVIASGSAVSVSTGVPKDLTTISVTAGDWDVFGNITFLASGANMSTITCNLGLTSALNPDASLKNLITVAAVTNYGLSAPYFRVSVSTTTTVYLVGRADFLAGTVTMCGGMYARRVR